MPINGKAVMRVNNPAIKAAPHPSSNIVAEIAANLGDKNGREYSYSKSMMAESILENFVMPLLKNTNPIQILMPKSKIADK